MKTPLSFPVALALTVLAGVAAVGCTSQVRLAPIRHAPIWHDNGTPPATIALEREVRHYRDEAGAVWDDRGRRVGAGS
jgi:hypothetical protein